MLFIETLSNPLNAETDIALAHIGRDIGAILAVDNCFCSPSQQTHLLLVADIVTHSVTKYMDEQGSVLGGSLVGSEEFIAPVVAFNRSCAPTISPFNAWVRLKGLETPDLRMRAQSENAQRLPKWLAEQSSVRAVHLRAARSSRSRVSDVPAVAFQRGVDV